MAMCVEGKALVVFTGNLRLLVFTLHCFLLNISLNTVHSLFFEKQRTIVYYNPLLIIICGRGGHIVEKLSKSLAYVLLSAVTLYPLLMTACTG